MEHNGKLYFISNEQGTPDPPPAVFVYEPIPLVIAGNKTVKELANVSLSPNPAQDLIQLNLPEGKTTLSLTDLSGNLVMQMDSKGGIETISLNSLNINPGMYFLQVQQDKAMKTIKIVKQ